jgi:hypothetical protein
MREYAQGVRDSSPPPSGAAAPPNGQPSQPNELTQLLAAYGGLVVNALNTGTTGADFGEWLASGFGNAMHAMIAGQGEDALTQAMLGIPELALFGEARLRKFAFEFCHFEEIFEKEEDARENEAVTAQGKG